MTQQQVIRYCVIDGRSNFEEFAVAVSEWSSGTWSVKEPKLGTIEFYWGAEHDETCADGIAIRRDPVFDKGFERLRDHGQDPGATSH